LSAFFGVILALRIFRDHPDAGAFFRVIPVRPFPCHSERSEESAVGNMAGSGGKSQEIPRR
jgi:hypothetical protein